MRTAALDQSFSSCLARSHPFNTLSFHYRGASNRAVWRVPLPTGDYNTDWRAGARMAAELIDASRCAATRAPWVHTFEFVVEVIAQMDGAGVYPAHAMRMGFHSVLDHMLVVSEPTGALLDNCRGAWRFEIEHNPCPVVRLLAA